MGKRHVSGKNGSAAQEHEGPHPSVADFHRAAHGFEHGAFLRVLFGEKGLCQLERRAFVGGHFAHVLEVLPVDAAPRDALVHFLQGDVDENSSGLLKACRIH